MMYKIGKPRTHNGGGANGGTTHKIREQLNFTDEKKWKQFSGRRLELIDKFALSERKASEQDDNIKQIATILRTEFGYPLSSASEFEKLVTAAVQSVRRNRKRSKKRLPASSSSGSGSGNGSSGGNHGSRNSIYSPSPSNLPSPSSSSSNQAVVSTSEDDIASRTNSPHLSSVALAVKEEGHGTPTLPSIQPKRVNSGHYTTIPSLRSCVPVVHSQQRYNDIVKSIISDLVNNVVPLTEQSQRDQSNGPNLTDFALSTNDQNLLSLGLHSKMNNNGKIASSNNMDIPFFLREKLLLQIQRSRSCSNLALAQGSIDLYSNLEILGEMSIRSAVAFVIERFFSNLMPSSMEYITSKTYSEESLSLLAIKLFGPATKHNLNHLPSKQAQLKLLNLVLGAVVKDFGFDPCLYPLSEVIHHLVMNQYPLLYDNNASSLPTSQRTAVLSSLSMKPQVANQDVNKKVIIRFKDREQQFTFHLLSNGPPTVNEIIENSKSLFQIGSKSKSLGLYYQDSIIHDDFELAKLFNSFTEENIFLEVKELSSEAPQLDGLNILSTASLQVKNETPTTTSPTSSSSVNLLDKIINRINKFPKEERRNTAVPMMETPSLPSVVVSGNKNFFQNGNLPQPVFQPLL